MRGSSGAPVCQCASVSLDSNPTYSLENGGRGVGGRVGEYNEIVSVEGDRWSCGQR